MTSYEILRSKKVFPMEKIPHKKMSTKKIDKYKKN